ncbi:MAG: hypothetical protein QOF63_2849 [Thermoanaerobaculia bacterium]|jgi:hypothetical protein|nr:hypothetical protein [Thermoanaerobaculia bacterium]
MNSRKNLAAQVAGAMAIAALVGTSAFAESRHSDATDRDHGRQSSSDRGSRDRAARSGSETQTQERHDTNTTAPQTYQRDQARNNGSWQRDNNTRQRDNNTRQRDESRNNNGNNSTWQRDQARTNNGTWNRNETRNNGTWNRNESRNNGSFERSQTESYRNNNRSQSYRNNRPSFDSRGRRSDFVQGRVSRFVHERGGYRIWVDGGRFPVWIPEARIGLFPHLRIGLSLRFGGYYDPLGYLEAYDYYNDGYYGGGGGYGAYSSGLLRGVVETVDYRRGTLVLRDDVSGSFVTTLIRDRRLETLRPGDYAEIAGDWTRSGVFEGLRLEDTRDGRY